jgi:HK97 family phage major capsid protein
MSNDGYTKQAKAALDAAQHLVSEMRSLDSDTSLTPAEKREKVEKLSAEISIKEAEARDWIERRDREVQLQEIGSRPGSLPGGSRDSRSSAQVNVPLTRSQSFADLAGRSATDGEFGEYVRALAYGDTRAMSEGVDANGGFLVPTLYSASVLDLARNQARVMQAGAQVVPLGSDDVRVAKLVKDPSPTWRNEASAIATDDLNIGEVRFQAKSLAVLVKASWELAEDAQNFGSVLRNSLAQAFAVKLDAAALYGSGTAPEPRGVKHTPGIQTTFLGANGAAITWDPLINAVQSIRTANFSPSGIIHAERTEAALSSLKDNTGQYLAAPAYVADVPRYATGQVPTDLTRGTATNATDSYVGDWSMLGIGVRTQFELKVLRERYADTGEIGFVGWLRADVQVMRPEAFHIVSGITG